MTPMRRTYVVVYRNEGLLADIEKRIEELEIRYSHQQVWIDELNQVVREQRVS